MPAALVLYAAAWRRTSARTSARGMQAAHPSRRPWHARSGHGSAPEAHPEPARSGGEAAALTRLDKWTNYDQPDSDVERPAYCACGCTWIPKYSVLALDLAQSHRRAQNGNVDVQDFGRQRPKLAKYLAKYLSKDLVLKSKGNHRYKRSRGITPPEEKFFLPRDVALDAELIGLFEARGAKLKFHQNRLHQEGAKWFWACSW